MGIVLALAAALLYGGSDFGGGLASRRLGSLRVSVVGSAAATMLAWATLILVGGPGPSLRAVAWGWPPAWPAGPAPSCCTGAWPAGR
jgi:hypothetical protein